MTVRTKKPTYFSGQTMLFVAKSGRKSEVKILRVLHSLIAFDNGHVATFALEHQSGPLGTLYRSEEDYAEATAAAVDWERLKRVISGLDRAPKGVGSGAIRRAEVILGLTGWEMPTEEPK